jgi:hypothetical protein
MPDDPGRYEVGYGKPPAATRFVKGQSGNRKGRPKDAKNLDTILRKVGQQKVTIKGNGRSRSISKLEASVLQLVNKAASGDIRAIRELLQLQKLVDSKEGGSTVPVINELDERVIESTAARIRNSEPLSLSKDSTAKEPTIGDE